MAGKDGKDDDEIWNQLFGGEGPASQKEKKKGQTSLQYKADKKSKSSRDKKRKDQSKSTRSSSSRSRQSHSSSNNRTASNSNQTQQGPAVAERLSQFLCTPKNRARLPPPPLRCKFLKYPHSKDRFTKWCGTNLELNYKWELHHDSLFPIPLDLMDPDYFNPLKVNLDPDAPVQNDKDYEILQLLEDRVLRRTMKDETIAPEQEAFLLQTQYLTDGHEYELTENQRKSYDKSSEEQYSRKIVERDVYSNPHSLESVQQSFIDVQKITRHPRRNVEVDRAFDVFPEDECLEWDYTHVHFDNDPAVHVKKCDYMPKFQEERIAMAERCSEQALLRCVNQKLMEMSTKTEDDDMDVDSRDKPKAKNGSDPDWFSLYSSDGRKRTDPYDSQTESQDFEWTAEYLPVQMDKKKMRFLVIPRHVEGQSVFYANADERLSLRHRLTDSVQDTMMGGKKGLSAQDKRFFERAPKHIDLKMPTIRQHEE